MHILYNIAGLYRPAGMERVLCDKAGWLVSQGHQVTILTTEQQGRPFAFEMDPRIEILDLGIGYEDNNGASLWDKLIHYPGKQRRHLKALKAILSEKKPDITVSMFCNEVNLLPRLKDGSRKVLEVHFSRFKRLQYARGGLWGLVDRLRSRQDERLVRRYDRFVVLTEDDRLNWGAFDKIRVIPNPVSFRPARPAALDSRRVIAVGRYTHQKALDRLIEAWSLIPDRKGWSLRLVGDGEDREMLEEQIHSLGLEDSVQMGAESNMAKVYDNASILALSSRYEGLPMALLECQAFGVPAFSFDCQCGPREIIVPGETGLLVKDGDVKGLAAALWTLMRDDTLRKEMGRKAFERAEAFRPEKIMPKWIQLFREIL